MQHFFPLPGRPGDPPLHPDLQLVVWQHLLPHDHREPGAGQQTPLRDQPGLQNGRPSDVIHLPHVGKHEQAKVNEDQIGF